MFILFQKKPVPIYRYYLRYLIPVYLDTIQIYAHQFSEPESDYSLRYSHNDIEIRLQPE